MNKWIGVAGVVVGIAAIVLVLFARENQPKIGIVDNALLLSQFSEAIEARRQLDAARIEWDKNLQTIKDSLRTSVETMTRLYDKSSQKDRKGMEQKLSFWNGEFSRYSQSIKDLAGRKENELMGPVVSRLNSFVKTWAEDKGYDVIMGTGMGGVVLSCTEDLNVTSEVIKDLNKLYGQPAVNTTEPASLPREQGTGLDSSRTGRENAK